MKLLFCPECRETVVMATGNVVNHCKCKKTAGKYLKDGVTAVITEEAVVFGIDNNSFLNAMLTVKKVLNNDIPHFDKEKRYDFFFTGWIPTKPGEVIIVKNLTYVRATDYYQRKNWTSQNPSTDINEVDYLW